jgi:hypothetical protein
MGQVESWLMNGDVQRLVVVVSGVDSGETLERWQFNVDLEGGDNCLGEENQKPNQKSSGSSNSNTKKKKKLRKKFMVKSKLSFDKLQRVSLFCLS